MSVLKIKQSRIINILFIKLQNIFFTDSYIFVKLERNMHILITLAFINVNTYVRTVMRSEMLYRQGFSTEQQIYSVKFIYAMAKCLSFIILYR